MQPVPEPVVAQVAEPQIPVELQPALGRVQASRLALTWSCPKGLSKHPFEEKLSLEALIDVVKKIEVGVQRVTEVIVSKERHQSGTAHYHAYVKYSSRINVRDMRRWDILAVHPNIATVSDWKGWVRYVMKDGDWCNDGVDIAQITRASKAERSGAWERALAVVRETCNPSKGVELIRALQPQQWILNSTRIMATFTAEAALVHSEKFPLPVKETRWRSVVTDIDILTKKDGSDDLTPVCILVGDTGIGKTEAAKFLLKRALGDACRILFVNHAEDFKNKDGLYDAFVWDEASFNTPQGVNKVPWTREQQIAVCGWDAHPRTLFTRHSNVVIPPMIPRVFTCNYLQRCVDIHDPAVERRVRVIDFGRHKLYE